MMEKIFHLSENGTTVQREMTAGLVTFLTMAYIIFVNPSILSTDFAGNPTGLSFDAAMLGTCIAAFIATTLMGLYANFPIAQAPGMGENFFFVTVVMGAAAAGAAQAWRVALGIVFISGAVFLALSLLRFRKAIIDAISPSLKNGIAAGIGLFIAFIGLQKGSIILPAQGTAVTFNSDILEADVLIFFAGLFITAILQARGVKGAILWGILGAGIISLAAGKVEYRGVFGLPGDHAFFALDIAGAFSLRFLPYIVVFLFMDLFDTVGTLVGVSERAGLMQDNRLPRGNRALVSDAVGTVAGACTGTSTVTSFVESAVGVEYGGRTGLTAVTAGLLFLAALVLNPLISMVGQYGPVTAPALVIVGSLMIRSVTAVDWDDFTEGLPAFLIIIGIPLSYNIADGLALGLISYPIIKLLAGRHRDVSVLMYAVAALFILRYAFITL